MLKTLKLVSIVVVTASVLVAALAAYYGTKGDPEIEKLLKEPGAVEQFKAGASVTEDTTGQVSPLVTQAKAFALRLNPPPPEVPDLPAGPSGPATSKPTGIPKPQKTISRRAKFNVVATCYYPEAKEKSLALIDLPGEGHKWVKQGQEVEHIIIAEIFDGGLKYESGEITEELTVPPKRGSTLLTNPAGGIGALSGVGKKGIEPGQAVEMPQPQQSEDGKPSRQDLIQMRQEAEAARLRTPGKRGLSESGKTPEPVSDLQSLEQKLKALDKNLAEVNKLLEESEGKTDQASQMDQMMMGQLKQKLLKNKAELLEKMKEAKEEEK